MPGSRKLNMHRLWELARGRWSVDGAIGGRTRALFRRGLAGILPLLARAWRPRTPASPGPEPLFEGFFTAAGAPRPGGGDRGSAPSTPLEGLGELPSRYGSGRTLLLPRDPTTLFVAPDVAGDAPERLTLRLFEEGLLTRQLDVPIQTPGFFLHGLTPGRHYHVELYRTGADGQLQSLGAPSGRVQLPSSGPSPDLSVRMASIPWEVPLSSSPPLGARASAPGAPLPLATVTLELPSSWSGRPPGPPSPNEDAERSPHDRASHATAPWPRSPSGRW